MPLQLLPMPESEWHIYISIMTLSFEHTMGKIWFPRGLTPADHSHLLDSMKRSAQRHPGRAEVFKVVDTDLPDTDPFRKIVGVSQWKTYAHERTEEEMQKEHEAEEADIAKHGFPPSANAEALTEFFAVVEEYQRKLLGGQPHVFLALLATRPGHGRRGIGALSLKYGCDKADRLALPMYLEGTPDGAPLYEKWGYQVLCELPFDAMKHGLNEPFVTLCMRREAQDVEA